jgi:D-alanine-D-alanine ligase-like ATP-grasp enzyme
MDHLGNFYFFEVNTAPGLEGTTLMAYRDAILRKLVNSEELLS